jgi:superfamily I DNA/RNA helicase
VALSTLSITENLNAGQKEAVRKTAGPSLVVAGPGTGKTLTIVNRMAHLIYQGVSPVNILAVTFTNRAAREMRERIHALFLGDISRRIFLGTFHLLGLRIIRENAADEFVIYNREEQVKLLKSLLQGTRLKAADIVDEISHVKSLALEPPDNLKAIFDEYRSTMYAKNALDFDDLILKPIEMFGDTELLNSYRERFRHIIIDEYQDINRMAKGLEFRVVFISGVDDGLIPYKSTKGTEDTEEERRLFYVDMASARDELFLIHGRRRFRNGRILIQPPPPFLCEIPEEYIRSSVIHRPLP